MSELSQSQLPKSRTRILHFEVQNLLILLSYSSTILTAPLAAVVRTLGASHLAILSNVGIPRHIFNRAALQPDIVHEDRRH